MGTYFFGFIGAFVRWIFRGFKGRYRDIWNVDDDDLFNTSGNELINNIIGVFVVVLIVILIRELNF